MGRYRLVIKPSAVKEIEAIPLKQDWRRIVNRISGLAADPRPHGAEKLTGRDRFRLRQGRYKIIYAIDEPARIVRVVKVGHRKDVYRTTP